MRRVFDSLFRRLSPIYMNKRGSYDSSYYVGNYLRHVNAWYGFIIRAYYNYVAYQFMAKPTRLPSQSRVLDIGCGVGLLVEQFAKLDYQVVGVDVHQAAIENSICPSRCFLVETTSCLSYPARHFDLIVSREVLEHIPAADIDPCIQEWDRVGKGVMVHIVAVAERGQSAFDDPTHVNVKTEQWWIDKFGEHGYIPATRAIRMFLSPLGSTGYFMMIKDSLARTQDHSLEARE